MSMKGYSTFHKAPVLNIKYSLVSYPGLLLGLCVSPFCKDGVDVIDTLSRQGALWFFTFIVFFFEKA